MPPVRRAGLSASRGPPAAGASAAGTGAAGGRAGRDRALGRGALLGAGGGRWAAGVYRRVLDPRARRGGAPAVRGRGVRADRDATWRASGAPGRDSPVRPDSGRSRGSSRHVPSGSPYGTTTPTRGWPPRWPRRRTSCPRCSPRRSAYRRV